MHGVKRVWALLLLVGCSFASIAHAERVLRVGAPENPPIASRDANGMPQGLAIDVLEAIAQEQAWRIEYVWGSLSEGLDGVRAGKLDLLVGVGYSLERSRQMEFSRQSLLSNWGVVYGRRGVPLESFLDLKGKRVALLNNSLHTDAFLALVSQFDLTIQPLMVDDYLSVFKALDAGQADAGVVNRLFSISHQSAHDVDFTGIVFSPVTVHYAASPSGRALLDQIDLALTAMKQDKDSVYHRSLQRWVEGIQQASRPVWLLPSLITLSVILLLSVLVAALLRQQVRKRTGELQVREQSLRESEGRYRALFEYSTVAVWEEDFSGVRRLLDELREQGVDDVQAYCQSHPEFVQRCINSVIVLDINQAALNLYGARDKDALHRGLAKVMSEESLMIFKDELVALDSGKTYFEAHAEQCTLNGEVLQTLIRVTLAPGCEQNWSRVYVSVVDLTRLQLADGINQRLLAIMNATPDFVGYADRDGRVLYINDAFRALMGKGPTEPLGMIADFHTPASTVRVLTQGLPAADRDGAWSGETEMLGADGRIIPVSQVILAHRNPAGETNYYSTIARDISGLRILEEERSRAATEWMQAMDSFEDAIYLVDLDDTLIRANQAFYDLTGLKHADAIGKPITKLMHPFGELKPCPVCQARAERRDAYVLVEPGPGNRFNRPVEISVRVIRDDHGEPLRLLLTIHDLTRTRQIEAELRRYRTRLEELVAERTAEYERVNRELEAFAHSVSHDLRAPLRGINGFSIALLEDYGDRLDDTGRDYLQRVRAASTRMGELIDDMLLLSRVTRHEMKLQSFSLSDLVAEVSDDVRASEPERTTPVHIQADMQVIADKSMLRGVMTNLLSNAWKFTARKPSAGIEIGCDDSQGEKIYFVRDTGVGFDMQYADKLFGAFQRLHGQQEYEGTGIGLATVQRIIHRHGGRVWAEGKLGEGATFFFTLPAHVDLPVEAQRNAP